MKKVHFYYDRESINPDSMPLFYTHKSTITAINNSDGEVIHSTALSAVNYAWDKGFRIFLHQNGKYFEVHEGITEGTDKEIKKGHNIERIWIAGIFDEFFNNKIN